MAAREKVGRILQSVSIFQDFTYPMTIGWFWLFYILLRALGAFLLGAVLWFLLEAVTDRRLVGAVWVSALFVEYAPLYATAGGGAAAKDQSISCLHPRTLVTSYCNLNVFGQPVGQLEVFWAWGPS